MVYTAVTLGPSQGQMSDLAEGHEILLNPHHMKGDVTFHLTNAQLARVQKALAAGKGCRLKFSASQIKHMGMHGSGKFVDFLKDTGKHLAKKGLEYGLEKGAEALGGLAQRGIEKGTKALGKKIGQVTGLDGSGMFDWIGSFGGTVAQQKQLARMHQQHGAGWFGSLMKNIAHVGVDGIASALGAGLGGQGPSRIEVMNLRRMEKQHGKGFFGNILKNIAHVAVDGVAGALGAGVGEINPHANPNEALRAALMQKKVKAVGSGLTYP